jgi:hypothetical protein
MRASAIEERAMSTKAACVGAFVCLLGDSALAATPPCAEGPFREFDFWAGEWDVKDAQGKPAGVNAISKEENGCVLVERWRSEAGGHGQSYNYYDPAAKRWKQVWIGLGLLLHMEGGFTEGHMRLEGPLQYVSQNRVTILRGTWTPLPDGRVRQHFEESEDNGATWSTWFDGYYSRRP